MPYVQIHSHCLQFIVKVVGDNTNWNVCVRGATGPSYLHLCPDELQVPQDNTSTSDIEPRVSTAWRTCREAARDTRRAGPRPTHAHARWFRGGFKSLPSARVWTRSVAELPNSQTPPVLITPSALIVRVRRVCHFAHTIFLVMDGACF